MQSLWDSKIIESFTDTFQIADRFVKPPLKKCLNEYNWQRRYCQLTGKVFKYFVNGGQGEHAPKLTVIKDQMDFWNCYVEVTPSAWLNGSNVKMCDEEQLFQSIKWIGELTSEFTGYNFNPFMARVSRIDFTRNFYVGEDLLKNLIDKYKNFELPKYIATPYDTGITFRNQGKKFSKSIKLYSKYHETLSRNENQVEIEESEGILRLEICLRKIGVNSLVRSLDLKSNKTKDVITLPNSMRVLDSTMKQIKFSQMFDNHQPTLDWLMNNNPGAKVIDMCGFLYIKENACDLSSLKFNKKSLRRIEKECLDRGLVSLKSIT